MIVPKEIPCFWIEPAGLISIYLRRYSARDLINPCLGESWDYHNANTKIGELLSTNNLEDRGRICHDNHPHDDLRWPKKCDKCDYLFTPEDKYQLFTCDLYINPVTGEIKDLNHWEAGAMYNAWWYKDLGKNWQGPDGLSLMIKLPNTEWFVDGPSTGSKDESCWSRIGDPKTPGNVTARPSILYTNTPRFHAWLTNGKLEILPDTEPWE